MQKLLTNAEVLTLLNQRYSSKKFDPDRTIDDQTLETILSTFHLAASSWNLQPRWCVVIDDDNLKQKLQKHSYNQPQISTSSHLLVLCRKTVLDEQRVDNVIASVATARWLEISDLAWLRKAQLGILAREGEWLKHRASNQVHIVLGQLLMTCTALGIDACPIGWFDAQAYDEVLGLHEKNLASVVVLPIGYRADDDKYATATKARLPKNQIIFHHSS